MASLDCYTDAELELLRDFLRAARELQDQHAARISARGGVSVKNGRQRVTSAAATG